MADIVFPGDVAGGPIGSQILPDNYNLVLYRGDYFAAQVTLKDSVGTPLNLTGFTGQCSIKENYDSVTAYAATVTLTPASGIVLIEFPSTLTKTIVPGSYIWDFQLTNNIGNTRTYITGDVTMYGEVTNP